MVLVMVRKNLVKFIELMVVCGLLFELIRLLVIIGF